MPGIKFVSLLALIWAGLSITGLVAAAGTELDHEMNALEQARDLPAMQARMDRAGEDELDSPGSLALADLAGPGPSG